MVKIETIFLICINIEVWVCNFLTYLHGTLSFMTAISNFLSSVRIKKEHGPYGILQRQGKDSFLKHCLSKMGKN